MSILTERKNRPKMQKPNLFEKFQQKLRDAGMKAPSYTTMRNILQDSQKERQQKITRKK